ncbi:MAG: hypothetical protein BGO98_19035 [Myxococcales bacterium 68-20]|nr:MAG: hypothetical protein BGO98_19035 [Myxococcales bacterium 68-20]
MTATPEGAGAGSFDATSFGGAAGAAVVVLVGAVDRGGPGGTSRVVTQPNATTAIAAVPTEAARSARNEDLGACEVGGGVSGSVAGIAAAIVASTSRSIRPSTLACASAP